MSENHKQENKDLGKVKTFVNHVDAPGVTPSKTQTRHIMVTKCTQERVSHIQYFLKIC